MRRLGRLLAVTAAGVLLIPAAASAQGATEANATLPDIEDEVMCTICGTTLQLSNSPQAERERAFINELISQGLTKEEIKDRLVGEYGPEVLAVPQDEGFDLTAWILPVVGVLAAIILIGLAARRWRREGDDGDGGSSPGPGIGREENERLEADLGKYQV